jgi:S-adenosyl methyltransferase
LPTENNTHEAAQNVVPESRIVYVDNADKILAISHASSDLKTDTVTAGQRYNSHSATAITFRSRQEVARLLAGLDLVPPGVSPLGQWSLGGTGTASVQLPTYAALARKP